MLLKIKEGLLGIALGDALGVPVENQTREQLKENPVKNMMSLEKHNNKPGIWSDDTSMTLCLAESLCYGFDTENMGKLFLKWLREAYWTPYGKSFDIGDITLKSLERIEKGVKAEEAGGKSQRDNGNGALMRILPISFYIKGNNIKHPSRFEIIHKKRRC